MSDIHNSKVKLISQKAARLSRFTKPTGRDVNTHQKRKRRQMLCSGYMARYNERLNTGS